MSAAEPSIRGRMRELALPIYLPSLLSSAAQNAIQILLPLYALELGGGPALAAAMLGLRGAGTMLVDVPAGLLVARLGDKSIMVAGLSVLVLMGGAAAASDSAWVLAGVALLFGAALGMWLLARITYITDRVPLGQRGRVISVMAGLHRAGALIGPLLGGIGAQTLGYPAVFAGTALLFALSLAVIAVSARGSRPAGSARAPATHLLNVLREQRRVFATAGTVMISLQVLRSGRQLMIPLWGATMGLDTAWIGLAFSVSSAVDMLMFYPAGMILDHVGRKWALGPSLAVLGTSLALLPLTGSFAPFLAVCMLSGLGNGFGTGIFMTLGGDLSPARGRSEFLGVWRLIGDVGSATGPFLIGALAEVATIGAASVATGGLALGGLAVLAWLVPEPLRAARETASAVEERSAGA